jgi:hypothetical protein
MARPSLDQLKALFGFTAEDAANLRRVGPLMARHQGEITDRFYQLLEAHPETARRIAGRLDGLKRSHAAWVRELFSGVYDEAYYDRRWNIGLTHVKVGVEPFWVDGVMSLMRRLVLEALAVEIDSAAELARLQASLLKLIDLELMIINLAYQEMRYAKDERIRRALVDNLVPPGGEKPKEA